MDENVLYDIVVLMKRMDCVTELMEYYDSSLSLDEVFSLISAEKTKLIKKQK